MLFDGVRTQFGSVTDERIIVQPVIDVGLDVTDQTPPAADVGRTTTFAPPFAERVYFELEVARRFRLGVDFAGQLSRGHLTDLLIGDDRWEGSVGRAARCCIRPIQAAPRGRC